MKMTTMPVVWCNDPNSVNNKPTAFALHGIQLQGNVTEKQVLALRQLVNAAAEGRLILPADGTFVLMDSGISLDSAIVNDKCNKENINTDLINVTASQSQNVENVVTTSTATTANTYIVMEEPASTTECSSFKMKGNMADEDILYDFLCCAKCMHQNSTFKCNNNNNNFLNNNVKNNTNSRRLLLRRYFQVNEPAAIFTHEDPVYNIANKYIRRQQQHHHHHPHRKHCHVSALTARNRHHHHQQQQQLHKLPMQSVKIFHNRFNFNSISATAKQTKEMVLNATTETPTTKNTLDISNLYAQVHKNQLRQQQQSENEDKINLSSKDKTALSNNAGEVRQQRQRKIGAVVGGLEHSVLVETKALVHHQLNESATKNCDKVLPKEKKKPTTIVVPDLISFDDITTTTAATVDEQQQKLQVTSSTNIMDILAMPNNGDILPPLMQPKVKSNAELDTESKNVENSNVPAGTSPPRSPRSNTSSRKTSFDSSCTISSMDSGFIEMQNKLENSLQIAEAKINENDNNNVSEKIAPLNYKECLTQSKNRRKSYEEFKAMFNAINALNMQQSSSAAATDATQDANGFGGLESISEQTAAQLTATNTFLDLNNCPQLYNKTNVCNNDNCDTTTSSSVDNIKRDCGNEFVVKNNDDDDDVGEMNTVASTKETMRKNSDFLSKILDQQVMAKEKEKAQIRRKSYEEFKRLVRECEMSMTNNNSNGEFKRQNSRHRKIYSPFLLMRHNNLAKDDKANTNAKNDIIIDQTKQQQSLSNYKTNFKFYDKLVYGTIYDIIQRKNDIYNLTYQKYDKYMTYGTIYEILHRKSSLQTTALGSSVSLNGNTDATTSTAHQRKSLTAILEKSNAIKNHDDDDIDKVSKLKKVGLIYDIIQKQQQQKDDAEQQIVNDLVDRTVSGTIVRKYGTIYDILQGEKSEIENLQQHKLQINRFTVNKIDESQVQKEEPITTTAVEQLEKPTVVSIVEEHHNLNIVDHKVSKPNKMRRLSNILSYKTSTTTQPTTKCEKTNSQSNLNIKEAADNERSTIVANIHKLLLPLDSEELYTRIVAQNRAAISALKHAESNIDVPDAVNKPIVKSSSLDAISTTVTLSPPNTPSPPRPRRSLKQQHNNNCYLTDTSYLQRQRNKKMSLDSSKMSLQERTALLSTNQQQQRRWSNQFILETTQHLNNNCGNNCVCLACRVTSKNLSTDNNNSTNSKSLLIETLKNSLTEKINGTKNAATANVTRKKSKSRRLSEFTRGEFLNEKP